MKTNEITIEPNVTMFGKRDKHYPFKAVLDGQTLVIGESKTACESRAIDRLVEVYRAAQAPTEVRIANDGTVYVARWIACGQIEYWIYRNGQRGGGCVGICNQSLQSYMDEVVRQYNECTAAA